MQKLRCTKSLLDSWLYSFKRDDGYEDFLCTLRREKKPPTQAMLDGVRFENVLDNYLDGEELPSSHEWFNPVTEMAEELWGSQQQVVLFRDIEIDGQPILLQGVLDFLRAGVIWDCKFSKTYHLNKYFWEDTTQTAMYFALATEARVFRYIISDGKYVYRETYPREIVPDIVLQIRQFLSYLKKHDLYDIYVEHWKVI